MLKVFENIIKEMDIYSDNIEQICDFIKFVDVAYAKMLIADKFNYCRPVIITNNNCDKSFVNVTGLRHCLIEKLQQNELYVTNDLIIGNAEMDGMLLYGTNAVGKTSFIRALGISVIMAQAGLYVPASSFEYIPYKYIFTRILGNDNIFKGLSTFAVEMSELRTILRLANKNSLVLGDELCSGTESTSATSIFVSGIQHLNKTNCSFIFATHLHEILDYDEIIKLENVHIKHMSVIYNKEIGCLEYDRKLKDGPGNNMYGLEVCKSLNLPEEFLENAHNIRMKYHPESSSILERRKSRYNSEKIVGICEMCGENMASEVHHLQYQREANENGIISRNDLIFHKNHKANLLNICEECHQKIHKENKQYKKVKTTKGMTLKEI
jgi:DNA mismatch repair protein MutS